MGYVMIFGACISCRRTFGFNPSWVPSVFVNGKREPVCRDCVERANPLRVENGLEPIRIHPEAYEPADENEVLWNE